MSAELRVYVGETYVRDGITESSGSLVDPIKAVTTPGLYSSRRSIVIPKDAAGVVPTLLWSWQDHNDFDLFMATLRGGVGYLHLAWSVDKPTSATDFTPLGTHFRTQCVDLSCHTPFILNSILARVHATLSTAAGVDGNGFPAILDNASTVEGRVYKIWAWNPSTTTDYTLDVVVRD